jgi:hypothetical protein
MIAVLTVLISLAAFVVALFSLVVNEEKFRLDLYNRRFDIYMRTVRFYQVLFKTDGRDTEAFAALQNSFILASREAQFLFDPASGIYKLLDQLNRDSMTILGQKDRPEGLPPEHQKANLEALSAAILRWDSSMEPLEAMMAPYLNYHYASAPEAVLGRLRQWCRVPRRSAQSGRAV